MYYLRSRYYGMQNGRFVNADNNFDGKGILRHNIFAYVNNSPVTLSDPSGRYGIGAYRTGWFRNMVQGNRRDMVRFASGDIDRNAEEASVAYKKITNKELDLLTFSCYGRAPKDIKVVDYTTSKQYRNVAKGALNFVLNFSAQNGVGDAISSAVMGTWGIMINGGEIDQYIAVAAGIASETFGDIYSVTEHTLTVEYSYDKGSTIFAYYTWYSDNYGGDEYYDGIHVYARRYAGGWLPCSGVSGIYDVNW